jgi:hypothetical protein
MHLSESVSNETACINMGYGSPMYASVHRFFGQMKHLQKKFDFYDRLHPNLPLNLNLISPQKEAAAQIFAQILL